MIWPAEPLSEECPRSLVGAGKGCRARAATPIAVASSTPATKANDFLTAPSDVTKTIADMICGPAIIVIASGRTFKLTTRVPSPKPPRQASNDAEAGEAVARRGPVRSSSLARAARPLARRHAPVVVNEVGGQQRPRRGRFYSGFHPTWRPVDLMHGRRAAPPSALCAAVPPRAARSSLRPRTAPPGSPPPRQGSNWQPARPRSS